MTTLVVAEKPSVARDIARVLGATGRREGWLEGRGYRVTWALGHLVRLAEPDDYGGPWAGRWSFGQLPMIPECWELRVETRTRDQFAILKKLLRDPGTERIVCATDAGREGEHIFRLIHDQAGCRKPFERLWISSLTDEAIRAGFAALRPGHDFDHLAAAARARARADWLVGMNLTRAYTVHNRVLCTIGRVQTPTLALVVERDRRIATFVKHVFYELVAVFAEGFAARHVRDGETRIERRETAERLLRELSPHRTGTVTRVEQHIRRNRPPPLHDLTTLQRDANRRFGFTAAQVLQHAQALYETHKLISYPRTESRHLSEDMVPKLPGILERLEHPLAGEALARLHAGHRLGKAHVDRTRLTDHHAIIPTGRIAPASLPAPLRQVYERVVARFVAIFLPEQVVEETEVEVRIGEASFIARASRELDPGWKRAEPRRAASPDGDGETADPPLPPLTPGQVVTVDRLRIDEKETAPPRPYDDATLLAAMKNAGREIDDETLAAVMKDTGLGTPATRAETIEKLIRTGYLERQRKQLRATPKGQALIGMVAPPLRSPELTAAWEQQLREIEQGERPADAFERMIADFVRALIPEVAAGPALDARPAAPRPPTIREQPPVCPKCGQGRIIEGRRGYGCNRYREGCDFVVWKTIGGLTLDETAIRTLIERGRVGPLPGLRDEVTGEVRPGMLVLDTDGRTRIEQ